MLYFCSNHRTMNDYRIGNLVNDNYMVIEIDANGLGLVDANLPDDLASYIYVEYENIKPIPLTEEWLNDVKILNNKDFYLENEVYYKNGIFNYVIDTTIDGQDNSFYFIEKEVNFTHEVQNLYFALTNKELCTHDQ